MLRSPEQFAAFQMRSHQGRVEEQNPLPGPAGQSALDEPRRVGFLGCRCTSLGHPASQPPEPHLKSTSVGLFSVNPSPSLYSCLGLSQPRWPCFQWGSSYLVVNSTKLQKHISTERRGSSSIRNVVKKLRGCCDLGFVGDSGFYFPSKILCKWYLELGNAFNEGAVYT